MELQLSDKVRGWLYVFTIFFTPTLAYLQASGKIDDALFTLGTAYIAAISLLARLNLSPSRNVDLDA